MRNLVTKEITPGSIHPAAAEPFIAIEAQDPLARTGGHHLLQMGLDIAVPFDFMHLPGQLARESMRLLPGQMGVHENYEFVDDPVHFGKPSGRLRG